MSDDFDDFDDFDLAREFREGMRHAHRHCENLDKNFRRLLAEPCMTAPEVGDRVVVASGLLGMGHPWIRHEAIVLEIAGAECRVRFIDYQSFSGDPKEMWVHPSLITAVIKT
jgi:hypothetical protein